MFTVLVKYKDGSTFHEKVSRTYLALMLRELIIDEVDSFSFDPAED